MGPDRTRANNKIILRLWGYEEPHVAEDPYALLVIPSQVDCSFGSKFVASNTSSTFLFLPGKRPKVLFRELENVEDEISRYDIPLVVTSIDSTFCDFGDVAPVCILSAR